MKLFKVLVNCLLLLTTPTLLAIPQSPDASNYLQQVHSKKKAKQKRLHRNFKKEHRYSRISYDEIIQLLHDIETGQAEKKYTNTDLERIDKFLKYLSKKGSSKNFFERLELENDIALLLDHNDYFSYSNDDGYEITHAVIKDDTHYEIQNASLWRGTKKFLSRHKKAIIIGAIVVVATAAIVVTVVYVSGTAAGVGTAAAVKSMTKKEALKVDPALNAAVEESVLQLKDCLQQDHFAENPALGTLSWEEKGKILTSTCAHDTYHSLQSEFGDQPFHFHDNGPTFYFPTKEPELLFQAHHEIDTHLSSDYASHYSSSAPSFNTLSYTLQGERALEQGYFSQGASCFTKAIEQDPYAPLSYLHRSNAYFQMGEYDKAFEDFNTYAKKAPNNPLFSSPAFTLGLAKGFSEGALMSAKDLLLFIVDFITNPINTTSQLIEAFTTLAKLVHSEEWRVVGEALVPEVFELITDWNSLSSYNKGERSGYIAGKLGGDILAPGALGKVAAKSLKAAEELAVIVKNIHRAQETLILETAAVGIGDSAKVAKIIEEGEKTRFFAKELGISSQEMKQLKKTGQLETTIKNKFDHLSLPKQDSIKLFQEAENYLKRHRGYMPENEVRRLIHETGIPTFPRPNGIPENYRVKLSSNGAGIKYVHPTNEETYIRVMPGKAHSSHLCQQKPYVVQMRNGKTLDRSGNIVLRDAPEAHIALEEFTYIGE